MGINETMARVPAGQRLSFVDRGPRKATRLIDPEILHRVTIRQPDGTYVPRHAVSIHRRSQPARDDIKPPGASPRRLHSGAICDFPICILPRYVPVYALSGSRR